MVLKGGHLTPMTLPWIRPWIHSKEIQWVTAWSWKLAVWTGLLYTMKVLRQKRFVVFVLFACVRNFLYESSRWRCSNMDFKRKYEGFCESFFHEGLRVQLAGKLFFLETFMVYSNPVTYYMVHIEWHHHIHTSLITYIPHWSHEMCGRSMPATSCPPSQQWHSPPPGTITCHTIKTHLYNNINEHNTIHIQWSNAVTKGTT